MITKNVFYLYLQVKVLLLLSMTLWSASGDLTQVTQSSVVIHKQVYFTKQ